MMDTSAVAGLRAAHDRKSGFPAPMLAPDWELQLE
jgi:hypothetical protein